MVRGQLNPRIKFGVVAVAIVAAAVTAASGLRPGSASADTLDRLQAVWSETGVMHAKFTSQSGELAAEEWLDRRTSATRKIEYEGTGDQAEHETIVQVGLTTTRWNTRASDVTYVTRAADENDPWLEPASRLLGVKRALNAGRARIAGSTSFRGREVYEVELLPRQPSDAPTPLNTSVLVDQATLLPLRFIFEAASGESGALDVEADELAPTTQTDQLFTADRPWTIRDTKLDFDQLKERVPFAVYTLGRAARGGLRFEAAALHETTEGTETFTLEPELFIGYGRGGLGSQPDFTLTEHAAGTKDADARLAAFKAEGTPSVANIAGAERTVFVLDSGEQRVHFAMVLGSTLVKGAANMSKDELLRTLEFLEPAT